jgi:hypothetical protein
VTTTPNWPNSAPSEPNSEPNGSSSVPLSTPNDDGAGEPRTPRHERDETRATPIPHRTGVVAIAVALIALAAVAAIGYGQLTTQQTADSAQDGKATAEQQAQAVAGPLAEVCRRDAEVRAKLGALCSTATSVQQSVTADVPPPRARDGRGIISTLIASGHLLITYTDGTTEDKGAVVGRPGSAGSTGPTGPAGPSGAQGATGDPGRAITGSAIDSGDLLLSYSDGTTEDVGRIVGPAGRGIRSTDIVDDHLIVTYDDGTTQDAGPVPQARGIANTEVRDCHLIITYTDGTTQDAGDTCSTQTVAPTTTTTTEPPPSIPDGGGLLPLPTG